MYSHAHHNMMMYVHIMQSEEFKKSEINNMDYLLLLFVDMLGFIFPEEELVL